MIIKNGRLELRYNKKEHDMGIQDSNIRNVPKEKETTVEVDNDRVVKGAKVIIQTYFMWKIADRVVEKVLR